MPPIDPTPCSSWMALKPSATRAMASSHDTTCHSSSMESRTIGCICRSSCAVYPYAKRPLTHEWPSLAPPAFDGVMRTTRVSSPSPCTSALNEQPTPQYAHVVSTERVGIPSWTIERSVRASVGQAWTQAPHETHSEDRKSVPPGVIRESKPRPWTVSANVPWVSSQARTQREQTMQAAGS